jgi:O-antigen biosynthesis protein WbqV
VAIDTAIPRASEADPALLRRLDPRLHQHLKPALSLLHDTGQAGIAFLLAMLLRLGLDDFLAWGHTALAAAAAVAMATALVAFVGLRTHHQIWRFTAAHDLGILARAVLVAALLFLLAMFVIDRAAAVPRSVPVIQALVLFVLLVAARLTYQRLWRRHARHVEAPADPPAALIWGADPDAAHYVQALASDARAPFRPVGVVDDSGRFRGRRLHGVPVLGGSGELPAILERLARRRVRPSLLVASRAIHGQQRRQLMREASRLGLGLIQLPRRVELPSDGVDALFTVERIAARQPVSLPEPALGDLIRGRRVLVTGAGGSIGSELVRQVAALGPAELVLFDRSEYGLYAIDQEIRGLAVRSGVGTRAVIGDIRDARRLRRLFAAMRPEIVFHAAALKHVPLCEQNLIETVLNNVQGTRNVADATVACGALAMVQISTDKAVNPTNVMGASKRVAELYCQSLDWAMAKTGFASTRFMITRFGNVLGSSGSVVPLFRRQVAEGGPVTVTHPEITRYFMSIDEAVGLVLRASAAGLEPDFPHRGCIFVLDMGEPLRIVDVARRVIRLAGLDPDRDIEIVFTGLRDGEKLFESLFYAEEVLVPTAEERVLAATSSPLPLPSLERSIETLIHVAKQGDEAEVRSLLGEFVPSLQLAAAEASPVLPATSPQRSDVAVVSRGGVALAGYSTSAA